MFPGRALGLVPAGGQRERVAVRLLPVTLLAGLTLLGLKGVYKVSFTREIYARGSVGVLWL